MEFLENKLKKIYRISDKAQEALSNKLKKVSLKKGDLLLMQGNTCKHLYFLQQGCIRGYYYLDHKEVTHWFGFDNDFVTSFHSFITQQPSVESLEALEDTILWSISHQSLYELYDTFPEIERLGRMAYEKYYIRLEERYVNAQFKTAAQRYQELLDTNSHILQRVSLGRIASYLGISQETLSRIRAKIV